VNPTGPDASVPLWIMALVVAALVVVVLWLAWREAAAGQPEPDDEAGQDVHPLY